LRAEIICAVSHTVHKVIPSDTVVQP
jgi:hypothetical protein